MKQPELEFYPPVELLEVGVRLCEVEDEVFLQEVVVVEQYEVVVVEAEVEEEVLLQKYFNIFLQKYFIRRCWRRRSEQD